MLCERCNQNEATVHLTQVVDGAVQKLHLCESCAGEAGFDLQGPVSITDILLGMGGTVQEENKEADTERLCPRCRMSRADFKKHGRLGCPACYDAFADELGGLLKAMHHSEQHVGKVPSKESVKVQISTEIARIQKDLDQAIGRENYEEAARLRDRLQACRAQAVEADRKSES